MVDNINNYKPDIAIPPGDTLLEVLESQNMTQKVFAERVELNKKTINEIVKGKNPITPSTALKFESVLGIPAHFWNNLERNFQETKARLKLKEKLEEEKECLTSIDYSSLVKYKIINSTKNLEERVLNLLNLYGVSSLKLVPKVYNVAFRKSSAREISHYALAAWYSKGRSEANRIEVEPYKKRKLTMCLEYFRSLTLKEPSEFMPELTKSCASCGIALIMLPYLPKTYTNGATEWLNKEKALLILSTRFRSLDIFWFTFFHEIGHLILHGTKKTFIDLEDNNLKGKSKQFEQEANNYATNILIPPKEYKKFVSSSNNFTSSSIIDFAENIGIHHSIVVGRLEYDKLISYSKFAYMKNKIKLSDIQVSISA